MELFELLKNLKRIKADPVYIRRSRELFGGSIMPKRSPWAIFKESLQVGSAIALAGILIILMLGGLSLSKLFSPFRLSSLDPAGLQAEAQAVDIQLELTKIAYSEPFLNVELLLKNQTTTIQNIAPPKNIKITKEAEKQAEDLGIKTPTSSVQDINLDQALDKLSE